MTLILFSKKLNAIFCLSIKNWRPNLNTIIIDRAFAIFLSLVCKEIQICFFYDIRELVLSDGKFFLLPQN